MKAINYIKKYHKYYIGYIDNSIYDNENNNYNYYLNKYFYNININDKLLLINNNNNENIEKEYKEEIKDLKLNYSNYNNEFVYTEKLLEFNNTVILLNNNLINLLIKYLYKNKNHNNYIINIKCQNIIINLNKYIQDLTLYIICDNVIFKNSNNNDKTIICKNFISKCDLKDELKISCNNFINYSNNLHISYLYIYNEFINYNNNITNQYKNQILDLNYYNNDFNKIIDLINNFKIRFLICYNDNLNIIDNDNINTIVLKMTKEYIIRKINLNNDINNLLIYHDIFINFNNFKINNLNVYFTQDFLNFNDYNLNYINSLIFNQIEIDLELEDVINNFINLIKLIELMIKFKFINKFIISYRFYIYQRMKNLNINFNFLHLNELIIQEPFNIFNINNIKHINLLIDNEICNKIFFNNNELINNIDNYNNNNILFKKSEAGFIINNKNNKINSLKFINNILYLN